MLISSTKKLLKELSTLSTYSTPLPLDDENKTPDSSGFCTSSTKSFVSAFATLAITLFAFQPIHGQDTKPTAPSAHSPNPAIELPVTLRQNVTAGNTPVGTKIQARLTIATLVNGIVIPEGAILTGEVTESAAKSATKPGIQSDAQSYDSPSRLSIRLDSAVWKNHPAPLDLSPKPYLTEWFYPPIPVQLHDHDHSPESGFPDASHNPGFGTGGIYPGQRNPMGPPISPPSSSDPSTSEPRMPKPQSDNSQHREQMKGIESTRSADGNMVLNSKSANIKLDKNTTYVFASGETSSTQPYNSH